MDFFVKPNWASGVRETFEFLTTVFTTQNGNEQRSAERRHARRSLTFQSMLHGDDLADFRAYLHQRRHYLGYMPEPVQVLGLVNTLAPMGATSLILTGTPSADPDTKRIVITGFGRRTFATVTSHASGVLTLTEPLEAAVQPGDEVRLCIPGRLPSNMNLNYETDTIAVCQITFNQEPGEANHNYATDIFETFLGREVFNEQPNWAAAPNVEIISDYETSDYRRGVIKTFSPISFLSKITQFTFLGRDTVKMNRLIDFFNRHLGRCEEFWCPSWTSDLELVAPITSGSSTMVVRGSGVGNSYLQSTVEKAVAIKLFDGSWLYKEVTDLEPDDQTTIITFDDAFTLDVALGDVVGLYWLNVCRFATDAMTVQWITNEVAQTVLQIKTLEALPAEV
jgi:hypothetical protein